jgi:hypothetical protein
MFDWEGDWEFDFDFWRDVIRIIRNDWQFVKDKIFGGFIDFFVRYFKSIRIYEIVEAIVKKS